MQFYGIEILLHRPFFSRSLDEPGYLIQHDSNHPRSICISAARSIVKVLRIYRKQHTLRRTNVQIVHLIFTASLICIYNASSSKGVDATDSLQDLQFCCQALGEIGEAYQNSTRALEVIICIKREWFNKTCNFSRSKRRNSITEDRSMDRMIHKKRLTQSQDEVLQLSPATAKFRLVSDGGIDHGGNQNPQQLDTWQFSSGNSPQSVSAESLLGDFFVSGIPSSLLDSNKEYIRNLI